MKSYRASLSKIGVTQGPISYRAFYSRPAKLSDAMRAMESPGQFNEVFEVSRSDDWAQDCQGGTFDGKFTILVSNSKKTMYGFLNHSELHDADQTFNFKSITGLPFSLYHLGAPLTYDNVIYVPHFSSEAEVDSQVFMFECQTWNYLGWLQFEDVHSPTTGELIHPQFIAINPWDNSVYTCSGGTVHEFFLHDRKTGNYLGKTFKLQGSMDEVQGGFFSSNGHFYVSSSVNNLYWEYVTCFSALNAAEMSVILVRAELKKDPGGGKQPYDELEGTWHHSVHWDDGHRAQVHVILLENNWPHDNAFYKSYQAEYPEFV